MTETSLETSFTNGNICNWRGCCDSVSADDKAIYKLLPIGSRSSGRSVDTVDEANLENSIQILEEKCNSKFDNNSSAIGSNRGVSVVNSGRNVIRLRGGGYNGFGNGSGGGGGLSSSAGAGFSSNEDDPGINGRGVDLYNSPNSSSSPSTVYDRRFWGYEWVRRSSADNSAIATDENIRFKNRAIESNLETAVGAGNSFYKRDGNVRISENNIYEGDTNEQLANRLKDDDNNLNRKANDYSSNHLYDDCGRRLRYEGSLNIEGDGGFSQRGGGRTFGGRGDDHYSQRDGGFGGGGDGGLSIRDNCSFTVRDDPGLGVREYDAFGSKRDGGFDNRDSGCFGAGGDNGLGIRDEGGFGGRGDGGFYNRDDGGFNKRCDSFNNRSDSPFSNKRVYSNMNNSQKTDCPSENIGSPERNNGGQELNRSFNVVRNRSLNGQYNEYNQENRGRSSGYK